MSKAGQKLIRAAKGARQQMPKPPAYSVYWTEMAGASLLLAERHASEAREWRARAKEYRQRAEEAKGRE